MVPALNLRARIQRERRSLPPTSVTGSTPSLVHNNWEGKTDLHGRDWITEPASVGECSCHTRGGSWIGQTPQGIYHTLPGDCS